MFEQELTLKIRQRIQEALTENPSLMPGSLAQELGISEGAVLSAFEPAMCTFVSKESFEEVWAAMTSWEKVTFITRSPGGIIEIKGALPKGKHGHGYFNLMEKGNPLGGHLCIDALSAICFLEKPLFGLESLSVQFFNKNGDNMFAVYAGREKREIISSVKEQFFALRAKYQE